VTTYTDATSSPESPARDSFNLVFAQISEEWHTRGRSASERLLKP